VSTEPIVVSQPGTISQSDLIWLNTQAILRGVGQVFFQESVLSGALFVIGIAVGSPLMAVGAVVGSAIGLATARVLKFNEGEVNAGIFGFNSTLVGIATLFFFQPNLVSVILLLLGCVVATVLTQFMRRSVPFPTYTTPFIVTTWGVYFLGRALGVPHVDPGGPLGGVSMLAATSHGIGQVMFQGNFWAGLLFFIGIAVNNIEHAIWVLLAAFIGMEVAAYHATAGSSALHIERLVEHVHSENIALGLYGYNATLTAVALYLWRKSVIPPLLGIMLSVPVTELLPNLGLPALTAPFVLTTWIVMSIGWLEAQLFGSPVPSVN
jgi:urea transporter